MKKLSLKLISISIYLLARFLHLSYRYRYANKQILKNLKDTNQNFILAIWHQNLLPGILAQTGLKHIVIVSKSNDAEPVAFTCKNLGHLVVRGSSRKGLVDKNGQAAKEEMINCLKDGYPGAVTVDGPKGPVFKVKPGIIDMAKQSGSLIVPYVVCPISYWEFKSWDSFRLPRPFSKILISYGEPIKIDRNSLSMQNDQAMIEAAINQLTVDCQKNLTSWKKFSSTNWWYH